MAQGLPPLPKSLRGMLNINLSQWKDIEKVNHFKGLIEEDMNTNGQSDQYASSGEVQNSEADLGNQDSSDVPSDDSGEKESPGLQSSLTRLRNEMVIAIKYKVLI